MPVTVRQVSSPTGMSIPPSLQYDLLIFDFLGAHRANRGGNPQLLQRALRCVQ